MFHGLLAQLMAEKQLNFFFDFFFKKHCVHPFYVTFSVCTVLYCINHSSKFMLVIPHGSFLMTKKKKKKKKSKKVNFLV